MQEFGVGGGDRLLLLFYYHVADGYVVLVALEGDFERAELVDDAAEGPNI